MKFFLVIVLSLVLTVPSPLLAEQSKALACAEIFEESIIGQVTASAGIFANFWGSKGSVSYESRQAFRSIENLASSARSSIICPAHCRLRASPAIYFRSTPHAVLSSYSDHSHCERLSAETRTRPLVYKMTGADSLDSIGSWIEKFSRGKGQDGKDLYARCDASCSPRYRYLISKPAAAIYALEAEVICGHARDQDDNNYDLEYGMRWACENS